MSVKGKKKKESKPLFALLFVPSVGLEPTFKV